MWESKIRKLIRMLEESDSISEIEIWTWGRKVRISKKTDLNNHSNSHKNSTQELVPDVSVAPQAQVIPSAPAAQPPVQPGPFAEKERKQVSIKSPMVGTFYRAPAPGAKPYVEAGEEIKNGQVVCIVEAMKLMNEIESEVSGRIAKICVENAQAVEFGQELFLIEAAS